MSARTYLLASLLLLNFVLLSQDHRHFRTTPYTYTPLHMYQGGVSMIGESDEVANYHFERDMDGKLVSIKYEINGTIKPLDENYTCSPYIWASINTFEYRPNELLVRHFDHLNQPLTELPAISKYTLNEKGQLTSLKLYDTNMEPAAFQGIHVYQWKYFRKNKVGEIRFDEKGNVVRMNNWFPFDWVILDYNEENQLITITSTSKDWKEDQDATVINFTIANKEVIRWVAKALQTNERTNLTGPGVAETRYIYNVHGYLIKTCFFDVTGERAIARWGHAGFVRQYNYEGNRLQYRFINTDDEFATPGQRGYCGQKFTWSKEGRFRLLTYYLDQDESPMMRVTKGYAQIRYLYNHDGQEIGKIYLDENDQIINTQSVQSTLKIENHRGEVQTLGVSTLKSQ